MVELKKKDNIVLSSMISGLIAGSFSKLLFHPIDTIKAKIQVHSKEHKFGLFEAVRHTYNNEGMKGFYRGLPTAVLGAIPGCVLYFGSYEYAKKNLLLYEKLRKSEFLMYFISGMFAETMACLVFVPVDVIKERMQVQSNLKTYSYNNDMDAIRKIFNNEGVRGLYKAYGATIMSFGPNTAFYFMFYEYFKGLCVKNDAETYLNKIKHKEGQIKERTNISFHEALLCSGAASALSSIITNPLDLVKLRMQVQRASYEYKKEEAAYRNFVQGLYYVLRNEGILGLYRGCLTRAMYSAPLGAVAMTMVELLKPIFSNLLS